MGFPCMLAQDTRNFFPIIHYPLAVSEYHVASNDPISCLALSEHSKNLFRPLYLETLNRQKHHSTKTQCSCSLPAGRWPRSLPRSEMQLPRALSLSPSLLGAVRPSVRPSVVGHRPARIIRRAHSRPSGTGRILFYSRRGNNFK